MSSGPHPLCRQLGSKKLAMYGDAPEVEELQRLMEDFGENYWCRSTWTDTGPDGGWVTYARCAPGRSCFQPAGEPDAGEA